MFDYLNLISNEVPPDKVEFFSCNQNEVVGFGLTPTSPLINQYAKVENDINPWTDEPNIVYEDKKFKLAVPKRSNYNAGSLTDNWTADDARIRDKFIIIRLTYRTALPLQLGSLITTFRYSAS